LSPRAAPSHDDGGGSHAAGPRLSPRAAPSQDEGAVWFGIRSTCMRGLRTTWPARLYGGVCRLVWHRIDLRALPFFVLFAFAFFPYIFLFFFFVVSCINVLYVFVCYTEFAEQIYRHNFEYNILQNKFYV
jgi:hypothetical protein